MTLAFCRRALLVLLLALTEGMAAWAAGSFVNPIVAATAPAGSADPSVVWRDGYYYYCKSLGDAAIGIARARRLEDIGSVPMVQVWAPPANTAYSKELWAPELMYLQGKWYIYFAASDGNNVNHRMYVLEGNSQDPQGSYTFKGKIAAPTDYWAIDGTVLQSSGQMYFVWSGWRGANDGFPQVTFIAPMSNPWTISGERHDIASPDRSWEMVAAPLLEGHSVLYRNGKIHIVYSASGSWTDDYTLGRITYSGGDILHWSSWIKADNPVFVKNTAGHAYGPGHNSFVKSPDGTEDWIVYHAIDNSGGGWAQRSVRAQKFSWNADDTPNFGLPVALGAVINEPAGTYGGASINRMEAANFGGSFIRHAYSRGRIDANVNPYDDSRWKLVPGLADANAVSIESVNFPGRFLRHRGGEVWLDPNDGSGLFAQDATWRVRVGRASASGVSFESINFPGEFLRHRDGLLWRTPLGNALDNSDATFFVR